MIIDKTYFMLYLCNNVSMCKYFYIYLPSVMGCLMTATIRRRQNIQFFKKHYILFLVFTCFVPLFQLTYMFYVVCAYNGNVINIIRREYAIICQELITMLTLMIPKKIKIKVKNKLNVFKA